MTPLRQKMIDAMLVRGFSVRTQQSYLDAVVQLSRYYRRSPDSLSVDELQAYFLYLVKERHLSPASCRLYLNALRFFYVHVLQWPAFELTLHVPRREQRIPELLTREEVARIVDATANLKHRTLLATCYACGLRVSEVVALQVHHYDRERRLLRIEQGKGRKDRVVIVSPGLLAQWRLYWQVYHPSTWLFYGRDPTLALSITSAQRVFQRAKARSGVQRIGGIHSLRHAYATHQLESGLPVYRLQRLLGHNDLHSTLRYVHWVPNYREGNGTDLLAGWEVGHGA